MGLDLLSEYQPQRRQWNESNSEIDPEAASGGVTANPDQRRDQPGAILDTHGQDCTALNDDLEQLGFFADETEQAAGENQMTGRRDRQKLRQPFHHAENERFDQYDDVHSRSSGDGAG